MAFILNKTEIYTLLFNGGNIEIKPKTFINASPEQIASGMFKGALDAGQIEIFEDEASIPGIPTPAPLAVVSTPPVTEGLTEEQFKKLQAEKQPQTPEETIGGLVEKIGKPDEGSPVPPVTASTDPVVEPVVEQAPEPVVKTRKSKAKDESKTE